ncbi:MAG: PilZ domain-containing protein [Acidobacteriota bacterium]|nr:PilZ domain-containing protein [Acidobacteriota bacterium]
MEYQTVPGSSHADAVTASGQRSNYRHPLCSLAYVNLDHANGGIIHDISKEGMAIQAVAPLRADQPVHLRFELLNPRLRLEVTGRVAWGHSSGQCGVEFLNIPERSARLLKDWIFIQLLTSAQLLDSNSFVFDAQPQGIKHHSPDVSLLERSPSQRMLSSENEKIYKHIDAEKEGLGYFPLSETNFARVVDGLILLSALMLFFVVAFSMTHVLPQWPMSFALGLGTAGVFGVVYWSLFSFWNHLTPGSWLASMAYGDPTEEILKRARFR